MEPVAKMATNESDWNFGVHAKPCRGTYGESNGLTDYLLCL